MRTCSARFGLGRGRVDVPAGTPWAALGLAGEARTYHYGEMTLVAHAPRALGTPRSGGAASRLQAADGAATSARLAALQHASDPTNVFPLNANIRPSV
jgi:hypothetical protein